MWDNVILLRNAANVLIASSATAMLCGLAYYIVHLPGLFPVRTVHLREVPHRVDAQQVLEVARAEVRGNLLTADIEHLRVSLERLPWIRGANVRRRFPDALVVDLEEQQAVARWNDNALVNHEGEIFVAHSEQLLPHFIGQEGTSAEILQHHARFSQQLDVLGLAVDQIALSPRHAWRLRLSNGMLLELGREQMQDRLERFISVQTNDRARQGAKAFAGARLVDLRYRNGFAVRQVSDVRG